MVDRIKPQSGEPSSSEGAASSRGDKSNVLDFSKFRANSDNADSLSLTHPVNGLVGKFRRSDLNDQGKLRTMVRATLSELVDSECKETAQIAPKQREAVLDYLEQNPFVQQKIQNYLSTVLS
jgi:hypothetical protein